MNLLLVTYDLKTPGRDYASLHESIKQSTKWWHYLESTWVIATNETVREVSERLRPKIDSNDRLLIVDMTGREVRGWLPRKAWDWLKENGAS